MDLEADTASVEGLAPWTDWVAFADALELAPRLPGVYLLRLTDTAQVVYAGMAGERAGSGGSMQGIRGRLTVYRRGRGAVSGFGEAALDRALADSMWVEGQLAALRADGPKRVKVWAQEAIAHVAPEVRWAICGSACEARALEGQVVALLGPHGLWNRAAAVAREAPQPEPDPGELLTVRGYIIDLDVLYRAMHRHSAIDAEGSRVYAGNAPEVPAMKRLLHSLFGAPVKDAIDSVNDAVLSAARDRLRELGWASKDPGRSGRYVLHRDI